MTSSSARSGAIFTRQGRGLARRAADGFEERGEGVELLQSAEARRVRRAHVHHEVVGVRREHAGAALVVADGLLDGGHPALADVHAEHRAVPAPCKPREAPDRGIRPAVVEAHPVHECAVVDEPEQARALVAGLGDGGDGAHLDMPEAELAEPANGEGVLVEPRRDAERRGEGEAERLDRERRIGTREELDEASEPERRQHPDHPEREVMGVLGVHAREDE
jgi:hypothetical protein